MPSSSEVEHLTVNQNVAGSIPAWAANVDSSSIGRAPDCGSGGCEFDSHLSTQRGKYDYTIIEILFYIGILFVLDFQKFPITPTKYGEAVQVVSSTDCKSAV